MSDDESRSIVPQNTRGDMILDTTATIANVVPYLGGIIASVLSGMSNERKLKRIREVLDGLAKDLEALKEKISQEYVKSDDFSELLENTLSQAANEHSEEKRRVYRDFLVNAISSPGELFDDQKRFLRTLEGLQPDHIRVLKAMLQAPTEGELFSTRMQTLVNRLPDIPPNRVQELVNDLAGMNFVQGNHIPWSAMVTGESAQDLNVLLTATAHRFIQFIKR